MSDQERYSAQGIRLTLVFLGCTLVCHAIVR